MPQRWQTRRLTSIRPRRGSPGCAQREQKRIGRGSPGPAAVPDRSIRMRAVTPGDENTEAPLPPTLRCGCTGSGPNFVQEGSGATGSLARMPIGTEEGRELWGSETSKAIDNFTVSGERVPAPVVRWLGRIKAAAARVNCELGLLDGDLAERVGRAGDEVAEG